MDSLMNKIDATPDAAARNALLNQFIEITAETYVSPGIGRVPQVYTLGPQIALAGNLPMPIQGFALAVPYVVRSGK